jgi:acyl-coenzyme A synthetase/AMP-(fatty) acid ligase
MIVSYALSGGLAAGRATRIYTGSNVNAQTVTRTMRRCNITEAELKPTASQARAA